MEDTPFEIDGVLNFWVILARHILSTFSFTRLQYKRSTWGKQVLTFLL